MWSLTLLLRTKLAISSSPSSLRLSGTEVLDDLKEAGSVQTGVHAAGGWIALVAMDLLWGLLQDETNSNGTLDHVILFLKS
jgi:hypothetical protein